MAPILQISVASVFMSGLLGAMFFYAGLRRRKARPLPTDTLSWASACVVATGTLIAFAGHLPSGMIALTAVIVGGMTYVTTPMWLRWGAELDESMRRGRKP